MATVDEMMLHAAFLRRSSAEASGASELSELSRTPSLQEIHRSSKPRGSISMSTPGGGELDEESTSSSPAYERSKHEDESNAPQDATKENWRLIRRFLRGRQFSLPKRSHFAALLATPRRRDIILKPGLRFAADRPKNVRLLITHMSGDESPVPCNSCDQGRGPFKKCVAISKAAAGETTSGVVCCTNCATKKGLPHRCNVEDLLSRPAAVHQRKPPKGRLAAEPRRQPSMGESQVTKVDSRFVLVVHKLPVDGLIDLHVEPESVRLCSVAVGKVMVDMNSNPPFLLGTHGMFKLMPETSAQVSNASEAESVLHISTLKT